MKKYFLFLLSGSLIFSADSTLAAQKKKKFRAKSSTYSQSTSGGSSQTQLSNALRMAQSGQYEAAANALFTLSRRTELAAERPQIKYILGTMLMELKLYQTAAFQFVDVIRSKNPKYSRQAIEKLSVVADSLGDDTILNYAISRVDVNDFPANMRDMIHFRLGEIKMRKRQFGEATDLFSRVRPGSSYYYMAVFNKGLSELEENQTGKAIGTFNTMLEARKQASVVDTNRVSAQLALARAYYQKQDWESAIDAYAKVPRDTVMWHSAIFEQSWAMLRAARFRSALSNFQTLHSAYYEDFYMPESLLLRAIVYLYICKYDEMDKVLTLFEKTYGPVRSKMGDFLKSNADSMAYYLEVEKAMGVKKHLKEVNLRLPYIVVRNVLEQGDVKRSMNYLDRLAAERQVIESKTSFRSSPVGIYALKILSNRSRNTKLAVGDMAKTHLLNMRLELRDLYEQAGFIRYEMINGQKEVIKKQIAGRDLQQIDDGIDRKFYIENGYEYYPYQGEVWLDEVGNYHYLGKQSCE